MLCGKVHKFPTAL